MRPAPRRLLALDMDGTLLRNDLTVSAANQEAVARALAESITVVLATGRMYCATQHYADLWPGHSLWVAANNGALIRQHGQAAPIYRRPVELALAREVARWAAVNDLYLKVYVDDLLLVAQEVEETRRFSRLFHVPYQAVGDVAAALKEAPTKLVIIHQRERMADLEAAIRANWGDAITVTASTPDSLELMAPGVSKAAALQWLARQLGVDEAHVAAIGNERNDSEMIAWAGFGGAVANAPAAVRAAAPRTVAANEADGVAEFIAAWRARYEGEE